MAESWRDAPASERQPMIMLGGAILQRRDPRSWPRNGLPPNFRNYPNLYDILLVEDAGTGDLSLPVANPDADKDISEAVLSAWSNVQAKRAVFIDAVTVPGDASCTMLYFLPLDTRNESGDFTGVTLDAWPSAKFFKLKDVLSVLHGLRDNGNISVAPDSQPLIGRLDKFLSEYHQLPEGLLTLWRTPALHRTRQIVNNPLFDSRQKSVASTETNAVKNPLFGSGLVLPREGAPLLAHNRYSDDLETRDLQAPADAEVAAHRDHVLRFKPLQASKHSPETETMSWADRFPLHRAACEGESNTVRQLCEEGFVPNEPDDDSWTPLHYAAWYGQEAVVRVLMEDWQGGPADKNDGGSTPLHFAARNGHPELVKVLIGCTIVDADARDDNKKTPLQLCESLQLNEWQEVSRILRNPQGMLAEKRFRASKALAGDVVEHTIQLLDGSVKRVRLPGGDDTTALDLRDAVAGLCQVPREAYHLFAIWICSASLEVQLEPDMRPLKRLTRWPQMLELYTDPSTWATDHPSLFFRRDSRLPLAVERKTRSAVALKILFDEAFHSFINAKWPTTVAEAIHLAGLLMQIRFGDHDASKHKLGFLRDALETFVPAHLLHNQLKTNEWERRIYTAHREHVGKTDLFLLHRLFLQYAWQWPFYGATFFDGELTKLIKRAIRSQRDPPVRVAVTTEWISVIFTDTNTLRLLLTYEEVEYDLDDSGMMLRLEIHTADPTKFQALGQVLRGQTFDALHIQSRQAYLLSSLLNSILDARHAAEVEQEKTRIAQGGPRVLQHVSAGGVPDKSEEERAKYEERENNERLARYHFIHSFGTSAVDKCAAEVAFERLAEGGKARVADLKNVCYELGYWLGPEYEGARMILDTTGGGLFGFRDLVSWWGQAQRSFIFLLDDQAFKTRQLCTEIFLRNDPQRLGKVSDDKLMGVVRGLRNALITKRTEDACLHGLDPLDKGVVHFNDFVDWCARMGLIVEQPPRS